MEKVSVIIPNYNRSNVIGETIDALLKQSLAPFEIIVVDDGSTDNSMEVLKIYGDRIKILQQENKGPGAARNKGLEEAKGDFIQFMDSDDIPSLNKLEVQVDTLQKKHADIVLGPWVRGWMEESLFLPENVVLQAQGLPTNKSVLEWFLTDWSMVFQQTLMRKSLLDKVGGFVEDMKVMEDSDLFLRILLANAIVVFEQETLTLYRLGSQDKLTNDGCSSDKKIKDRLTFYLRLFENNMSSDLNRIFCSIKFQKRLFILMQELKSIDVYNTELNERLSYRDWMFCLHLKYERGYKGVQKRLKGHRWSHGYQTALLTKKQIKKINELGYTIKR